MVHKKDLSSWPLSHEGWRRAQTQGMLGRDSQHPRKYQGNASLMMTKPGLGEGQREETCTSGVDLGK